MSTRSFFVVSSGRSGTAMLHKALAAVPGVEMHHEYMVHLIQPLGVRRYQGLADADEAKTVLAATHLAAMRYCERPFWGDSSNKLSWLIPDLAALFPEARFVHLARDGRKVAGSYFRKLADECYDDRSTKVLRAYLNDPAHVPAPPPEKKYWWPQPRNEEAAAFARFNQFERIAWHWAEINRVILEALVALPGRSLFVRLEDLRANPATACALWEFLGLEYRDAYFDAFARPHNVNRPQDRLLDDEQLRQFDRLCAAMMERLGYASRPEYVVNY